jgi:hypothetical protein
MCRLGELQTEVVKTFSCSRSEACSKMRGGKRETLRQKSAHAGKYLTSPVIHFSLFFKKKN